MSKGYPNEKRKFSIIVIVFKSWHTHIARIILTYFHTT